MTSAYWIAIFSCLAFTACQSSSSTIRRNLDHYPFGSGIDAEDPLAGLRVLQIAQAFPHELADVKFIVEQAGAAPGMATDRG